MRLGDTQGYELDFLTNVLRKIPALRPGEVRAQEEFEYGGRQGRIDFVIVRNNIRLAIEVDGRTKSPTGEPVDNEAHVRATRRQNALSQAGWTVLRFANTDVRLNPDACRAEIERSLSKTASQDARIRAAAPPHTSEPPAQSSPSTPRTPNATGAIQPEDREAAHEFRFTASAMAVDRRRSGCRGRRCNVGRLRIEQRRQPTLWTAGRTIVPDGPPPEGQREPVR
jgi:very-short-patch-repair endonuclease